MPLALVVARFLTEKRQVTLQVGRATVVFPQLIRQNLPLNALNGSVQGRLNLVRALIIDSVRAAPVNYRDRVIRRVDHSLQPNVYVSL